MASKLIYAAAERNKQAILDILVQYIPVEKDGRLLEVAAGNFDSM